MAMGVCIVSEQAKVLEMQEEKLQEEITLHEHQQELHQHRQSTSLLGTTAADDLDLDIVPTAVGHITNHPVRVLDNHSTVGVNNMAAIKQQRRASATNVPLHKSASFTPSSTNMSAVTWNHTAQSRNIPSSTGTSNLDIGITQIVEKDSDDDEDEDEADGR